MKPEEQEAISARLNRAKAIRVSVNSWQNWLKELKQVTTIKASFPVGEPTRDTNVSLTAWGEGAEMEMKDVVIKAMQEFAEEKIAALELEYQNL